MQTLQVTLIQTNLVWRNAKENTLLFTEKINSVANSTDLILLPEMFTTGFTMNPKRVAETMNGATINWLQKLANKKQCAIAGSLIIKEANKYYNRFVFVHSCGKVDFYNKRHLFSYAKENEQYEKGDKQVVINYQGWKICLQVCYDLRFPVWARNTTNYDLLIYVANWPKVRIEAWKTLLKARAIENLCYTVGVNRVGKDENNIEYNGNSMAFNCVGKPILSFKNKEDGIKTICLTKEHIAEVRKKFSFLKDQDSFTIGI